MKDVFEMAKELYEQNQWKDFVVFFDEKIKNDLDFFEIGENQKAELCFWQGVSYLRQNQLEYARQNFDFLNRKFPNSHLGIEGKILVLLNQNKNEEVIELSNLFQNRFPRFWQPYHYRGKALMGLGRHSQALVDFEKMRLEFPDVIQGYENKVQVIQEMSWQKGACCGKEYLNSLKELATHYNATAHQKFEYIERLLEFHLLSEAKQALPILKSNHYWYNLAQGMIESKSSNHEKAYHFFMDAYESSSDGSWEHFKILTSARLSFKRLKKIDEYQYLVEQLKLVYDDEFLWMLWSDLHSMRYAFRRGWQNTVQRLRGLIVKYGVNRKHLIYGYLSYLLKINQLSQVELILTFALDKYPYDYELQKFACIVAHDKQDWGLAKQQFDKFYQKHPNDISLFYHYTNILYNLKLNDEFKNIYQIYYKKEIGYLPNIDKLAELRAKLLLGEYDNLSIINPIMISENLNKVKELPFVINPVIHNQDNEVLIICIDGLRGESELQDWYDAFNSMEMMNDVIDNIGQYNDFDSFAKNTKQFNFLLCRDFSPTFGLVNMDENLQRLQGFIDKIGARYIVLIGTSAGGFIASLYGQRLKANLVFAMMPRLQAMLHPNDRDIYQKTQLQFGLTNPNLISIGYIQNCHNGFNCKTYMALCENEPLDALHIAGLDHTDKNLHISYFYGNEHGLLEYIGAKQAYSEFTYIIEKELKNNFELPMQRDIFSQIDGYKDSSFDRLKNG